MSKGSANILVVGMQWLGRGLGGAVLYGNARQCSRHASLFLYML